MALRGHTDGIPVMVAIAATAVLATIVVARYVKRRAEMPPTPARGSGADHV
jgi:multicomponent Na+:H+ antiporter subunit F